MWPKVDSVFKSTGTSFATRWLIHISSMRFRNLTGQRFRKEMFTYFVYFASRICTLDFYYQTTLRLLLRSEEQQSHLQVMEPPLKSLTILKDQRKIKRKTFWPRKICRWSFFPGTMATTKKSANQVTYSHQPKKSFVVCNRRRKHLKNVFFWFNKELGKAFKRSFPFSRFNKFSWSDQMKPKIVVRLWTASKFGHLSSLSTFSRNPKSKFEFISRTRFFPATPYK